MSRGCARWILEDARQHGLAAKPSGAGGGDLVLVFATDPAALDRLAVELWRRRACGAVATLPPLGDGLRSDPRPALVSRLQGFFRLAVDARRKAIVEIAGLDDAAFTALEGGGLSLGAAEHMVENVVGTFALPFGVATNFRVNGVDVLVPMVVEEASVIAAASNAAKMIREGGGFWVHADPPWMIAQIQLERRGTTVGIDVAAARIAAAEPEILALADAAHPRLAGRGGGARGLEIRPLTEDTLVVHVLVDCRDAMGANLLNTVAEAAAAPLERITGWHACLRILSNLTDRRVSHAVARVPPSALGGGEFRGEQVVDLVIDASRFAELDPYRAATHNKGIMNGVDAVVLATGNDWRAMEAGAHAYASRRGQYGPLATWRKGDDGWLEGRIALPTALGTVGGATQTHPGARLALGILRYPTAARLGAVVASVGLASNLAALRALATEGIQRGHMTLHARAVALAAGAEPHEIETLAAALVRVGEIKPDRAAALLASLRAGHG
jgi:degradative hydroxymethylglutaryl-CoA reductase